MSDKHVCDFCDLSNSEVELMVVANESLGSAAICSECIEVCEKILEEFREKA